MLQKMPEVDQELLEDAWQKWVELGRRRGGDRQRRELFMDSMAWRDHHDLYHKVRRGLYGTIEEIEAFEQEMWKEGMKEALDDSDWEIHDDIEMLRDERPRPYRCAMMEIMYPEYYHPDNDLGGYIYD